MGTLLKSISPSNFVSSSTLPPSVEKTMKSLYVSSKPFEPNFNFPAKTQKPLNPPKICVVTPQGKLPEAGGASPNPNTNVAGTRTVYGVVRRSLDNSPQKLEVQRLQVITFINLKKNICYMFVFKLIITLSDFVMQVITYHVLKKMVRNIFSSSYEVSA